MDQIGNQYPYPPSGNVGRRYSMGSSSGSAGGTVENASINSNSRGNTPVHFPPTITSVTTVDTQMGWVPGLPSPSATMERAGTPTAMMMRGRGSPTPPPIMPQYQQQAPPPAMFAPIEEPVIGAMWGGGEGGYYDGYYPSEMHAQREGAISCPQTPVFGIDYQNSQSWENYTPVYDRRWGAAEGRAMTPPPMEVEWESEGVAMSVPMLMMMGGESEWATYLQHNQHTQNSFNGNGAALFMSPSMPLQDASSTMTASMMGGIPAVMTQSLAGGAGTMTADVFGAPTVVGKRRKVTGFLKRRQVRTQQIAQMPQKGGMPHLQNAVQMPMPMTKVPITPAPTPPTKRWAKVGPEKYLPPRTGCRFTPYSLAHSEMLRPISMPYCSASLLQTKLRAMSTDGPDGAQRPYSHGPGPNPINPTTNDRPCLWEDIYRAIRDARYFVYIAGWSVRVATRLLRFRPMDATQDMPTMGELLKQKAAEGCKVLLLVWNELLSRGQRSKSRYFLGRQGQLAVKGVMDTHDEETSEYFQGSGVICQLCYRRSASRGVQGGLRMIAFSHHQKTIIVDAPAETMTGAPLPNASGMRRVVAFVGGIDLTNGRFDTPEHPLFASLHNVHKNDWYQPISTIASDIGPREPWHDAHSRVEGPVARDIMLNFEQRWIVECPRGSHVLIDLDTLPFLKPDQDRYDGPDNWTVQMLRSIDSGAATIRGVERSILYQYIAAIRRAEYFIYIENQYFIGSSQFWRRNTRAHATHPIPLEITRKIVTKIFNREPFRAYIVIPMHPDGVPEDFSVQEILYWQYRTIQAMYDRIGAALRAVNSSDLPTDYLTFYCLGQREIPAKLQPGVQLKNDRNALLFRTGRQQIYVHSKMMIVDDEMILIGSANINERSMNGERDTEIAVAAVQPQHSLPRERSLFYSDAAPSTLTDESFLFSKDNATITAPSNYATIVPQRTELDQLPRGDVRDFRVSVWSVLLGRYDALFERPHSRECMRFVNSLSEHNWQTFSAPHPTPMAGNLMLWPYTVKPDGNIFARVPHFPDTPHTARVVGKNTIIPNLITT